MRRISVFVPAMIFLCAGLAQAAAPVTLTLRDAILRVAGESRDVRIAGKLVLSARDEADMARAARLPRVTANAGQTFLAYQPTSIAAGSKLYTSQKSYMSYGVDIYQTIYDFGAARGRHEAAQAAAEGASDKAVGVKNQALLDVITAYFDALEARRMVAVARHEIVSLAHHAKDVTVLYREGVATKNDLLTASVRFNAARQESIVARSQEHIALARIRELLSIGDPADLRVEESDVKLRFDITMDEAIAEASQCRPDLRSLDKALRAAALDEAATRSGDKPEIFVRGGYDGTENRYMARDDNWRASVGVKLNIFNGGLTAAQSARARHGKERLIQEQQKLLESIRFQIAREHWDMKNARARVRLGHTAAAQADENARVTEARYFEGAGTSTEVLDALAMRTHAETELWRSTYALKRSYARLLYAMGVDLARAYVKENDNDPVK